MKITKRIIVFIILSFAMHGGGCLAKNIDELFAVARIKVIEYEYSTGPKDSPVKRLMYLAKYDIMIKNKGTSSIRIPTNGFQNGGYSLGAFGTMESTHIAKLWDIEYNRRKNKRKKALEIPETDLKIVEISPDDVTRITWTESAFHLSSFDHVSIKFVITKKFAKRYNVAAGEIQVDTIEVLLPTTHPQDTHPQDNQSTGAGTEDGVEGRSQPNTRRQPNTRGGCLVIF